MALRHIIFIVILGLVVSTDPVEGWLGKVGKYVRDFAGGARDMLRNYNNMKKANTIGADKYFHAKGNYEAARRGAGGRHAAAAISNVREGLQFAKGILTGKKMKDMVSDYKADQKANKWGRSGGDPNKFRPKGLDKRYRK